jgi:hypothetical protein
MLINLPSHLGKDGYLYQSAVYQLRAVQECAIIDTCLVMTLVDFQFSEHHIVW